MIGLVIVTLLCLILLITIIVLKRQSCLCSVPDWTPLTKSPQEATSMSTFENYGETADSLYERQTRPIIPNPYTIDNRTNTFLWNSSESDNRPSEANGLVESDKASITTPLRTPAPPMGGSNISSTSLVENTKFANL
jgi:hypothetical protein